MKLRGYTLIDCATGLSYGGFELPDQARDRAEVESIAKWEILNRDGNLVAWSKPDGAGVELVKRPPQLLRGDRYA
jgi:hypothetical protein